MVSTLKLLRSLSNVVEARCLQGSCCIGAFNAAGNLDRTMVDWTNSGNLSKQNNKCVQSVSLREADGNAYLHSSLQKVPYFAQCIVTIVFECACSLSVNSTDMSKVHFPVAHSTHYTVGVHSAPRGRLTAALFMFPFQTCGRSNAASLLAASSKLSCSLEAINRKLNILSFYLIFFW